MLRPLTLPVLYRRSRRLPSKDFWRDAQRADRTKSVRPKSICRDVVNRFEHVVDLRQDGVLDVRRVGHEAIEGGHSPDGRVELVE